MFTVYTKHIFLSSFSVNVIWNTTIKIVINMISKNLCNAFKKYWKYKNIAQLILHYIYVDWVV